MKSLILLTGLFCYIGCQESGEVVQAKALEADGTFANLLPIDGCAWHFSVPSGDSTLSFAFNDASVKVIEATIGPLKDTFGSYPVHIKYTPTGNKREVKCGWNFKANYDEIEVFEIRKM